MSVLCRSRWFWVIGLVLLGALFSHCILRADEKNDELMAAFAKGQALEKKGQYAEALRQFERMLELAPEVFGEDHPNTASIMNRAGLLQFRMGQVAKAESLFQRSLR